MIDPENNLHAIDDDHPKPAPGGIGAGSFRFLVGRAMKLLKRRENPLAPARRKLGQEPDFGLT